MIREQDSKPVLWEVEHHFYSFLSWGLEEATEESHCLCMTISHYREGW